MLPIFAGFSIVKLLSGFNIFDGVKLGKIIFNIIVASIVCVGIIALWIKLTQPTHKVDHQIIEKYYECPPDNSLIRFKLWKILNIGVGG